MGLRKMTLQEVSGVCNLDFNSQKYTVEYNDNDTVYQKPNWPVDMEHISATYQPIYCIQLFRRISSKEREKHPQAGHRELPLKSNKQCI